jgi:thiol-disulfide isomerase/thioredoxin
MKKRLLYRLIAPLIALTLLGLGRPALAQTPVPGNPVYIYLFWGEGCPHCAKARPFFENLVAAHPEIVLQTFEVYYDADNQRLFSLMAEQHQIEQLAVPTIFIGPYYLQGYSEEFDQGIEAVVLRCIQEGCVDPGTGVIAAPNTNAPTASLPPIPATSPTASPMPTATVAAAPVLADTPLADPPGNLNASHELDIPLLGTVNLDAESSVVSTALIAFVDGFNPCSLWVLTMLLALTLHTGSRKKVFIIGMVFLTVTAGIYALFIAGLFSVLQIASYMGWIRVLVALIALIFAIVNIKDYFWYKEGLSFTIADEKKPGLFRKMRAVMDANRSLGGLIGATITLAAGVSLVEFSCTAGFPIVWTNLLMTQNVTGAAFFLLLILYMVIYQLDEMVIFFSSVITLKASRVGEKHGRMLKLVSGILMLTLSLVMLVNPSLMNHLGSSLLIFSAALLATCLIFLIHRYLLPKAGIRIGSDAANHEEPVSPPR